MRNMAVSFKGGTFSRPGTKYCLLSGTSYSSGFQPRVMRYQFNTQQGFAIEAGGGYFRFFQNGAPILEPAFLSGYGPRVAESGLGLITGHLYTAPFEDVKLKGE